MDMIDVQAMINTQLTIDTQLTIMLDGLIEGDWDYIAAIWRGPAIFWIDDAGVEENRILLNVGRPDFREGTPHVH